MIMVRSLAIVAATLGAPAVAGPLQLDYDKAQAAFNAGEMAQARAGFAAILPRLDASPKAAASAAVVRARLGAATNAMADHEAAVTLLEAALRVLPPASEEAAAARVDLAWARELSIDLDGAARDYRAILAGEPAGSTWAKVATVGLARSLMFSDPAAAIGFADRALAGGPAKVDPKRPDDGYAQLLALRGRIELNAGRPAAARLWLNQALAAAGGLGSKVNAADIRIRGDLALASFLAGDMAETRRFLANTGANTLYDQGFRLGADLPLPSCAPVGTVSRSDMAVIEFGIADDGRVLRVSPVYATSAAAAQEFGRAVRGWSWTAAGAKQVPAFWRLTMRIEIRCSNEPPYKDVAVDLGPDLQAWIAAHAQEPMSAAPMSEAAALPALQAERERRSKQFGAQSIELLPVLLAIADSEVSTLTQALVANREALAIAVATGAPADLITYLEARTAVPEEKEWRSWTRAQSLYVARLEAIAAKLVAEGRGGSRGAAIVALRIARAHQTSRDPGKEAAALRAVIAVPTTALPDGDLMRQRALLRLASLEAAASRPAEAQALVAATGLSPEQCSLVANPPELLSAKAGSDLFPREAMEWGFEGVTRLSYDVDSSGVPVAPRVVIASPPFVFNESAIRAAKAWRYRPAAVGGQAISCADAKQTISFAIARK